MPVPVQAIYRDVDPDVPATYTLPPGSDFEFASSRVRLDGSGASDTFVPVLDVLTQDGRILASARPDQVFSAGDTGAVTFAPFLRRSQAGGASPLTTKGDLYGFDTADARIPVGADGEVLVADSGETLGVKWAAGGAAVVTMPGFHGHLTTNLVVASGNSARLNWDEWTIDGGTTYFQEGTLVGSALSDVKLMEPGWYAMQCWAAWVSDPASGYGGIACVNDDTDVQEPRTTQGVTFPVNFASTAAMAFQQVRYWPADFTESQTFAWVNRLEFWVIQNSGVNRTIDDAYCNIVYLGERL